MHFQCVFISLNTWIGTHYCFRKNQTSSFSNRVPIAKLRLGSVFVICVNLFPCGVMAYFWVVTISASLLQSRCFALFDALTILRLLRAVWISEHVGVRASQTKADWGWFSLAGSRDRKGRQTGKGIEIRLWRCSRWWKGKSPVPVILHSLMSDCDICFAGGEEGRRRCRYRRRREFVLHGCSRCVADGGWRHEKQTS